MSYARVVNFLIYCSVFTQRTQKQKVYECYNFKSSAFVVSIHLKTNFWSFILNTEKQKPPITILESFIVCTREDKQ